MIVKIVGSIIVIGGCYLYGQLLCVRLVKRLSVLKDLHKLGRIFKASVRYSSSDIDEVFEDIKSKVSSEVEGFLEVILEGIKSKKVTDISKIWNEAITLKLKDYYLSNEEKTIIKRFGDTIGILDKQMQIESADLFLYEMDEKIKALTEEIGVKDKLYKSISIVVGIFIVLLII